MEEGKCNLTIWLSLKKSLDLRFLEVAKNPVQQRINYLL
jgi:hypothetical protein